jgi:hypothetical protein
MKNDTPNRSVLAVFLLAILLIAPFFILGAITDWQLGPGLPVAALGTFCPMFAAMILVYRAEKKAGVIALLKRAFDFRRIKDKRWYAPILLTMPVVAVLSFAVQRLTDVQVPLPQLTVISVLLLCVALYIFDLGEELGWSGYAIEPMQARWGALKASLIMGLFLAVYHYIGLVQAHRSVDWIAWWTLYTVSGRVIMVWIFNHTNKSVAAMTLFHVTINATWLLYPVGGSFFDPRIWGLLLAGIAVLAVLVWDPLMRARHLRNSPGLYKESLE